MHTPGGKDNGVAPARWAPRQARDHDRASCSSRPTAEAGRASLPLMMPTREGMGAHADPPRGVRSTSALSGGVTPGKRAEFHFRRRIGRPGPAGDERRPPPADLGERRGPARPLDGSGSDGFQSRGAIDRDVCRTPNPPGEPGVRGTQRLLRPSGPGGWGESRASARGVEGLDGAPSAPSPSANLGGVTKGFLPAAARLAKAEGVSSASSGPALAHLGRTSPLSLPLVSE